MIAITGATGDLGQKLTDHLRQNTQHELRRFDRNPLGQADVIEADFRQWALPWVDAFSGVDTVVHLAGDASPERSWQQMIPPNLDAVVNVFNAAVAGGAKRIIFASSNHVLGGYREQDGQLLGAETAPLPGLRLKAGKATTPYAAFKLAGERLGKCYHDIHGISFIAVRIGFIRRGGNPIEENDNYDPWSYQMWLSNADYCQLMQKCIEADDSLGFAVINGVSNNAGMRWDIDSASRLVGYVPRDGYVPKNNWKAAARRIKARIRSIAT